MEMVEGVTRAEVASVLSEKLLAELSDLVRDASSTFSGRPSSTLDLAKRGTGLAPATGVEPRVRFVKCLDSLPCQSVSQRDVYLIAMISIIEAALHAPVKWPTQAPGSAKGSSQSASTPVPSSARAPLMRPRWSGQMTAW
jgi:hypothetical protein